MKVQADYGTIVSDHPDEVRFKDVKTSSVMVVLQASGNGGKFAGVGVEEWFVHAPTDE